MLCFIGYVVLFSVCCSYMFMWFHKTQNFQAGYAAYGGYSNYGQPQVATSAPQGTAYGAYPPTYQVEVLGSSSFIDNGCQIFFIS